MCGRTTDVLNLARVKYLPDQLIWQQTQSWPQETQKTLERRHSVREPTA